MYTELNNFEIYSNTPIFTINENGEIVSLPITNVCDTNVIRVFNGDKSLPLITYQDVRLNKEITCIPMISAVLFSSYDLVSKYIYVYLNNPEGFLDAYMEDHETGSHPMVLLNPDDDNEYTPGIYCLKKFDDKMYDYVQKIFGNIRYGYKLTSTKIKSIDENYPELKPIIQNYCKFVPEIMSSTINYTKTRIVFEIGNKINCEGKTYLEVSHEFLNNDLYGNSLYKCIFYSSINKFYISSSKEKIIKCRASYIGSGNHHNLVFEEFNKNISQHKAVIAKNEARKETILNVITILWNHREFATDLVKGGINLIKNASNQNPNGKSFADEVANTVTKMLNDEGIDCVKLPKSSKK